MLLLEDEDIESMIDGVVAVAERIGSIEKKP